MGLTLSEAATIEKNKLHSNSAWLILLDIVIPGTVETTLRVVNNNEDIIWNGSTYTSFPFELNEINETSAGEVPRVDLRISNVSGAIEAYLQQYDTYTKNNGFSPITVTISVINSHYLDGVEPEVEHVFELKQPKTNRIWATFTLGASSPFMRRFPANRMYKNHCRFIFKSTTTCQYVGAETECNKTLSRCRELSNSINFGGYPGMSRGGVVVVSEIG